MNKRNILIIGNNGLIGKSAMEFFDNISNVNLTAIDKNNIFDITKRETIRNFFQKNNHIEYILNCSGKNNHIENNHSLYENNKTDLNKLSEYIDINVLGASYIIEESIDMLTNIKSIINFSSIYSSKSPYHPIYESPKSLSYTISKHALDGLMKYYSTFYAYKKIRINNICPGGVESNQSKDFKDWYSSKVPFGRMTTPVDFLGLINFMFSDEASFITGQSINVNGGLDAWI